MIYSYCKRCGLESPGEVCQGCGKRAAASAQRDKWNVMTRPLADGRVWRDILLALLGAAALLLLIAFAIEAVMNGTDQAALLFWSPLPRTVLALAALGMGVAFLFLLVQGREMEAFILDPQEAHQQTWHEAKKWKSWARLQSADPRRDIRIDDGSVQHLSQERHLRWADVVAVKYKPAAICLYHTPHLAPMILYLPNAEEYELAKAMVTKFCKGKAK